MTLKDNILKKIKIKLASQLVGESISSTQEPRLDKQNAIFILEAAGYKHQHLRDIDMYFKGQEPENRRVIALDAELAAYRTSPEDVATRKSPTVKEMLSLGTIKKILWDEGAIIEKKRATLDTITKEAIDSLDLSFTRIEIEEIMYQSMASLAEKHTEGIREGILIFSELLKLKSPQVKTSSAILIMAKKVSGDPVSGNLYGPAMAYNHNSFKICYTDKVYALNDPEQKEAFERFANECEAASLTGEEVFRKLCEMVKIKYKI